ncbi:DNA repair protein xrcc4 [Plakobranchus ocellatus]|uniref:DNA repair protein xrcc4 n=1 Tax=Plakobranchus ocellatus TaxID=259542 RepID=A0AAV3ZFH0_9GAST|nr:DNA repair protein xrcc4 [Plakobranchus ocellatus]
MFETETENVALSEIDSETSSADGKIFLQTTVKDHGHEGYELVVLDGSSVWEGTISEYALDRQCETLKMDFNTYVKETTTALTKAAQSDMEYECIFKPQSSSSGQLTWKKIPEPKVKYNLGSVNLKKVPKPADKLISVLSQSISSIQSLQTQILSLQTDNERLAQERQNALKRLDKCVTAKDELEKDLFSKFVAVLNSKKERIRELEENSIMSQTEADPTEVTTPPVPSTSKTDLSSNKQNVSSSSNGIPGGDAESHAYDIDTDEESVPKKKKQPRKVETKQRQVAESSLNLGDDEEDDVIKPPVARRARKQPAKRETPAKPVLPRVSSISSAERENQLGSRRSSLRKSGSSKSNKSSDNLDPDDLMDDL